MPTLKLYLRVQLMIFVFGIVGPIFLAVYFAAQPDVTIRWMYWWGLFITFADIMIALAITESMVRTTRDAATPPPRSAQD
ncbi:hypothetical protein Mycch_2886 [Mycolicibacterium chubuense NBB4]|uniref:Uncharacterized protein n=1 Tax=Mycolicibacterium chubuense (strain NBB4) TaxID=710421 RepID=I4BK39_MYCCN|nr:hypothetical protein [Mycolicibacterium chubuense]AFM17646.1 hypothetical protein Mycch_2886 [Mycolicibacterium chubuense NBB4]